MNARGVECVGLTVDALGAPCFTFACDCGTATAVTVKDLDARRGGSGVEFAFTCDGCTSSHWVTIARQAEEPC